MKIRRIAQTLLTLLLMVPSLVGAACLRTTATSAGDDNSARIPFGKVTLTSTYLQPTGTLLASIIVPPTNYTNGNLSGASVLWTCDLADKDKIYFLVATNGDDASGGAYETEIPGVYFTLINNVGIRITMSGVTLSHFWQKVPVTSYNTSGSKMQIRLQDIPPLQAELYRVSSQRPSSPIGSWCGPLSATSGGRSYTCNQPNAYIQLAGDSSVVSFGHDEPGEDSAKSFDFWGANNGFGYGMLSANEFYQSATCVARSATPVVTFPTISVAELTSGRQVDASFSVEVECSDSAVSGTGGNQTALGFQVSSGAYTAAQKMGLVNASGGVTTLVSDNYDNSDMAKGVGITLQNSLGARLIFVGQPGTVSLTAPGGNAAGWYPVKEGATAAGSSQSGYTLYHQTYTATLKQLVGQTVTPGNVYATAYVLVRMQ